MCDFKSVCLEWMCVCVVYHFISVCVECVFMYVIYIYSSVGLCAVLVCIGYGLDIFITKEGRLTLTM